MGEEEVENNQFTIELALQEKLPETLRGVARVLEGRANEAAFRHLAGQSPHAQARALLLQGWCSALKAVVDDLDAILTAHEVGDETQLRHLSTDRERLIQLAERSVEQFWEN